MPTMGMSSLSLNTLTDGASVLSCGSPFHTLGVQTVRKYFLTSKLNLGSLSFASLERVLPSSAGENSQPCPNPSDSALVYPKTQFLNQDIKGHFVKDLSESQQQKAVAEVDSIEEEEDREEVSSYVIQSIMKKWNECQDFFEKHHPNIKSQRFVLSDYGSLEIYNIIGSDAGSYTCKVSYIYNGDQLTTEIHFMIYVYHMPGKSIHLSSQFTTGTCETNVVASFEKYLLEKLESLIHNLGCKINQWGTQCHASTDMLEKIKHKLTFQFVGPINTKGLGIPSLPVRINQIMEKKR
ncbi:Zona pellucida-binding protein 1 [Varanus komodoensis]|nr:Zona pellucida-binding protein 1 [Varanus komodoensis]